MKIKIIKEYKDTELNRIPLIGEEMVVSNERAKALISGNVAYAICEDADTFKVQITELEKMVEERDAQITELEKINADMAAKLKK